MTREQVETAFALMFKPLTDKGLVKTVSRRFRFWDQVPAGDKPCMFITKFEEENKVPTNATPNIQSFLMAIWIYTDAGQDQSVIPMTAINTILDNVTSMFKGSPVFGNVTLNGLVSDVRVNGNIKISDGSVDGNGVAFVPVKILLPSL